MKKLSFRMLWLLLAVLLAAVPAGAEQMLEGPGADSPEACILAYVDAMDRADAAGMMQCFAIESCIGHMDPEAFWASSPIVMISDYMGIRPDTPFQKSLLAVKRYDALSGVLYDQFLQLSVPEDSSKWLIMGVKKNEQEAYLQAMAAEPFSRWAGRIRVIGICSWDQVDYLREALPGAAQIREQLAARNAAYGAEAMEDMWALLELDGEQYVLSLRCVCYEGRWFLAEPGTYLEKTLTGSSLGLFPLSVIG